MPPGAFGENLLVSGLSEANVCLGDTYRAGKYRAKVEQKKIGEGPGTFAF